MALLPSYGLQALKAGEVVPEARLNLARQFAGGTIGHNPVPQCHRHDCKAATVQPFPPGLVICGAARTRP